MSVCNIWWFAAWAGVARQKTHSTEQPYHSLGKIVEIPVKILQYLKICSLNECGPRTYFVLIGSIAEDSLHSKAVNAMVASAILWNFKKKHYFANLYPYVLIVKYIFNETIKKCNVRVVNDVEKGLLVSRRSGFDKEEVSIIRWH